MRPVEIKKDIFWVGVVDWNSRDFHGYSRSPMGTTYNAFLIKDEKTVLVDSAKGDFLDLFLCCLSQATPLEKIDYLVVNHLEPDHAGCLSRLVDLVKPEKIFVSPMGEKAMQSYYHYPKEWPVVVVPSGTEISIGRRTLKFYETRMLHWPDNMLTYCPEDTIAFTSDAFGQNWASGERFADQVDRGMLDRVMAEYYANIVLPYSPQVIKTLDDLGKLNLDLDMVCPDHGLIWRGRQDVAHALTSYRNFALQKPVNKAVIAYDTMWHSTEKMALSIADGLIDAGVSVRIMHVKENHHSRVMSELFDAAAFLVGSPTHNNGILPGMADLLTYVKGLRPQNKVGACFGSFGWSGECVNILGEWLKTMKMDVIEPGLKVKNAPDHAVFSQCYDLGTRVAEAIKVKLG